MEESEIKNFRSGVELLAPAGSWECLAAALQGQADAVYFGVGELNMRAKSSKVFTDDDIGTIAARCHAVGVRAYLTLNTVVYDDDMPVMRATIDKAKMSGVDAIIASDIAVLEYCRKAGVPVHISTQVNISNSAAVRFYAAWADVMVLARELTLPQVTAIAACINEENIRGPSGRLVRLELFVHGALCMAISGKCYLSLHEFNLSANRGSCVQLCRRAYEVRDLETDAELAVDHQYIMSPKDLCTIHFLNKILDAGVSVLKIEGRARSAEYVRTVCEVYNEALLAIADGTYVGLVASDAVRYQVWRARLAGVFNRGFWNGYYLGQRLGEWSPVYGSASTHVKLYVGKVVNYYVRTSIVEVLVENEGVCIGDRALFIGPTTGVEEFTVSAMQFEGNSVDRAMPGMVITFSAEHRIRRADKLYVMRLRPSGD